jgi:predicted dehydrogenase
MLNVGIVGLGYWGPHYARILHQLKNCCVKYCCDLDPQKLDGIKKLYPDVLTIQDYKIIAQDKNIDCVVIVTPLVTHYELAEYFLKNGKHVLMEKPFTATAKQARDLVTLARKKKLVLMVGHVYKYNSGIRALKEMIDKGRLGSIYYIKAERMGLGPIRKHASALWDLATHDISIVLYLTGQMPKHVSCDGGIYIQKDLEDFITLNLGFSGGIKCSISASWFAPEKIRKITVVGSKGMAVFDDVNKREIIKVYDHAINDSLINSTPDYHDHQNIVRIGDISVPDIEQSEPLKVQVEHFLECISKNQKPFSDGIDGLNVIKILEKAQKCLNKRRKARCR